MENSKIIIDTNAWMAVGKYHVPIFPEIERLFGSYAVLSTLQGSLDELKKIQETTKGKENLAAKLALQIIDAKIKSHELTLIPSEGYVDNILIRESLKKILVLTADRELQTKLTRPFLIIKQKRYIELIE